MAPGGRGTVLVTSLRTPATPAGMIDMVAADRDGSWLLRVPLLPIQPNGAGDAVAALFLLHLLREGSARAALERAGSAVAGLLRATVAAGAAELLVVAAQEEFVRPGQAFSAVPF